VPLRRSLSLLLTVTLLFSQTRLALGWGSYGHEQINRAAAQLLPDDAFGQWFKKSLIAVTRLGVTPDYDWKKVGKPPTDPELAELRMKIDHFEHPLHFFEIDAFLPGGQVTAETVAQLPTGPYGQAWQELSKRLAANIEYVLSVDPEKEPSDREHPTAKDVSAHGTAPWRIAQLWRLGVEALKQNKLKLAFMYLGAMGHYVGDLSQPFHGALDFDGQSHHHGAAEGIHAAYETKMLEILAKKAGAKWDTDKKIWSGFSASDAQVMELARARMASVNYPLLDDSNIVKTAISLVAEMNPYLRPLEETMEKAIAQTGDETDSISKGAITKFMNMDLTHPTGLFPKTTPLNAALSQLGASSVLLSVLWQSAFVKARAENPALDLSSAPAMKFDIGVPIRNYPKPTYLPQLSDEAEVTVVHKTAKQCSKALEEEGKTRTREDIYGPNVKKRCEHHEYPKK
jgi:hypothetical protein